VHDQRALGGARSWQTGGRSRRIVVALQGCAATTKTWRTGPFDTTLIAADVAGSWAERTRVRPFPRNKGRRRGRMRSRHEGRHPSGRDCSRTPGRTRSSIRGDVGVSMEPLPLGQAPPGRHAFRPMRAQRWESPSRAKTSTFAFSPFQGARRYRSRRKTLEEAVHGGGRMSHRATIALFDRRRATAPELMGTRPSYGTSRRSAPPARTVHRRSARPRSAARAVCGAVGRAFSGLDARGCFFAAAERRSSSPVAEEPCRSPRGDGGARPAWRAGHERCVSGKHDDRSSFVAAARG